MKASRKICLVLALLLIIQPACKFFAKSEAVPAAGVISQTPTQAIAQATATIHSVQSTGEPAVTQAPATEPSPDFGLAARQHMAALSETIGPRVAGTSKEVLAAQYIQTTLEQYGYQVEIQAFNFIAADGEEMPSANIIAVKYGGSANELLVGAHYDSVDDGNGADDNASGVAVLLEVAEKVSQISTPYTIRFIAFGAEEVGLDGSHYFVKHMSRKEIKNTIAMINLDSLTGGDIPYVYGDAGAPGSLRDWILNMAHTAGLELDTRPARNLDEDDGAPCDCADYDAFQEAGIPFVFFESTNWNLGDQDGWTQVDPNLVEGGHIIHSKYDTIAEIERLFPGRIDQRLHLFATLLFNALTQFRLPD